MDRVFLCMVCSGVTLLVTAFALATPSMKPSPHAQFSQTPLVHWLHSEPAPHYQR